MHSLQSWNCPEWELSPKLCASLPACVKLVSLLLKTVVLLSVSYRV